MVWGRGLGVGPVVVEVCITACSQVLFGAHDHRWHVHTNIQHWDISNDVKMHTRSGSDVSSMNMKPHVCSTACKHLSQIMLTPALSTCL